MNTNTTNSTLNTTALNKEYYDRQLLEGARTRFVFTKYGQKRTVPLNNGRYAEFRRWNLFDIDENMCALEEGRTPEGQSLSQSTVEAALSQYGAYVEISDLLEDTAYDRVLSDSAELLGEQIGTVMEWVTRDVICSGTNVQYVGGKTAREEITAADTLTVSEVRKAVRTLKKAKARPFAGDGRRPHYICVCSPDAVYDLQEDPLWQDVSKYSNAESIYSGEIGRLFGVVFVESTEAKVIKQSIYARVVSHQAGSDTITVDELSEQGAAGLMSLKKVNIGGINYGIKSADAKNKTITLQTPASSAISAGTLIYTLDAGKPDSDKKCADVHMSVIFGKDAYGVIDLENGALESIVKPRGSAGADDPLDQRSTVGAKVSGFAAVILNQLWIVRIEHGVSE